MPLTAQQPFACSGTNYPSIIWPDGSSLEFSHADTVVPGLGLFPIANDADAQTFINFDYLMRPPLSDEEILLMPNMDVIGLYYRLAPIIPPCSVGSNPDISAGLYDLGTQYEQKLRERIYSLRTDLTQISDGKNLYRVLLPPELLLPPPCPSKDSIGTVLSIVGNILPFIPVVGWILEIGLVAYQLTDTLSTAQSTLKLVHQSQAVTNEVLAGINLVKTTKADPAPNQSLISVLLTNYNTWQSSIATANHLEPVIRELAPHMCGGAYHILSQAGSADKFFNSWKPFQSYFLSKAVSDMVLAKSSTGLPAGAAPILAGLGVGALLLLLL